MPNPTLDDLFQLREVIEPAIAAVLATATGLTVYGAQDDSERVSPFITVDFDPGEEMGHKYPCVDHVIRADAWKGKLAVGVYTQRSVAGQPSTHSTVRGQVARALQPGQGLFTAENLPYHQLIDCRQQSLPFTVERNEDYDHSELSFTVVTQIRESAWSFAMLRTWNNTRFTMDDTTHSFDAA